MTVLNVFKLTIHSTRTVLSTLWLWNTDEYVSYLFWAEVQPLPSCGYYCLSAIYPNTCDHVFEIVMKSKFLCSFLRLGAANDEMCDWNAGFIMTDWISEPPPHPNMWSNPWSVSQCTVRAVCERINL